MIKLLEPCLYIVKTVQEVQRTGPQRISDKGGPESKHPHRYIGSIIIFIVNILCSCNYSLLNITIIKFIGYYSLLTKKVNFLFPLSSTEDWGLQFYVVFIRARKGACC